MTRRPPPPPPVPSARQCHSGFLPRSASSRKAPQPHITGQPRSCQTLAIHLSHNPSAQMLKTKITQQQQQQQEEEKPPLCHLPCHVSSRVAFLASASKERHKTRDPKTGQPKGAPKDSAGRSRFKPRSGETSKKLIILPQLKQFQKFCLFFSNPLDSN